MMTLIEKATIVHYHRHRMEEHEGGTVEALGYRNLKSQTRRFEALTSAFDLNGSTVLDVGCGHGDLKGFLDRRFHDFCYVGIDQMAEFVTQARTCYGQRPECYFCIADFTAAEMPRAEYVFASGLLGYRCADSGFYFEMIQKLYAAAEKALAFNMLDGRVFPDHPLLVGHDPIVVEQYCRRLAPNVSVVQGYLDDDFTILMHKADE